MGEGYAKGTSVSVQKTQAEVLALLRRRRAERVGVAEEDGRAVIVFELNDRRVRFTMKLPTWTERRFSFDSRGRARHRDAASKLCEQAQRAQWRGLLLALKSKFVNVDSGIETFEEAFLARIVAPGTGGKTIGDLALPALASGFAPQDGWPQLPPGGPAS